MKHLLLFLIAFNTFAMSISNIDKLEINYNRIAWRLDKSCVVSFPKKEVPTYENMIYMECEKPALEVFEAEFEKFKGELRVIESARLVEVARVKALRERLKALSDLRISMSKCGLNQPNMKLFVKKIVKNNDVEKLECLESKNAEIESESSARRSKASQTKADCIKLKNETTLKAYFKRLQLRKLCNDQS